jgi:hypothetical protein
MRFDSPVPVPITVELENPFDFDLYPLLQFNGELADGRTAGRFRVRATGEFRENLLLLPGEMPGVLAPGETSLIQLEYSSVGVDVTGLNRALLTSLVGIVPLDDSPIAWSTREDASRGSSTLVADHRRRMIAGRS